MRKSDQASLAPPPACEQPEAEDLKAPVEAARVVAQQTFHARDEGVVWRFDHQMK